MTPEPKSAVDWAHRTGAVDEVLREMRRQDARARRRRLTLGAGALTLAAIAVGLFVVRPAVPGRAPGAVTTVVSAPEKRILTDGSMIELRSGAEVEVAFSADVRRVRLRAGEAHFAVAKDAQRPFVVEVGGLEVRAVGTAFTVDRETAHVEVIVTEGTVALQPAAGTTEPLALVSAGSRTTVPLDGRLAVGPVQVMAGEALAMRLAWRQPTLEFSATPLAEAISLFNQHNEIQFVLAEPSLGELQISGFLRADRIDTFLLLLEGDFGLKGERRDREIVLRR